MSTEATSPRRLHYFLVVSYETAMSLLFSLPRYRLLNRLKALFLRARGARVGKRVVFYPGVWISPGSGLELGDDVDLARNVLVTTGGGVSIGDRVLVGYGAQIFSTNHSIPGGRAPIFYAGHEPARVLIEKDAWLGANCVVVPGVRIGEGTVVAAGSVVTKDLPAWTICAGVPARVVRERD